METVDGGSYSIWMFVSGAIALFTLWNLISNYRQKIIDEQTAKMKAEQEAKNKVTSVENKVDLNHKELTTKFAGLKENVESGHKEIKESIKAVSAEHAEQTKAIHTRLDAILAECIQTRKESTERYVRQPSQHGEAS